jgi:hypothetical protein
VKLLGLALAIPDYSTFSRRAAELTVWVGRLAKSQPRHVVIDSTGLKVYGEGEWKARQHGTTQRRTWRKLHLAVDAENHEVIAAELTAVIVGDAEVLPDSLERLPAGEAVAAVAADGAYDTRACHRALSTGQNFQSPEEILKFPVEVEGDVTQEVEAVAEEGLEGSP